MIAVVVMILIALSTLLVPLVRNLHRMENNPSRTSSMLAIIAVAVLLPALTLVLYRGVGTPQAFNPRYAADAVNPAQELDLDTAVAALEARLQGQPDDVDGWMLLGRAYLAMERFVGARDAIARAHQLAPNNLDVTVEYAQALALASDGQNIDGEARRLLQEVLQRDSAHQKARWLLGISEFQDGRYQAAIDVWNDLLELLPPNSDVAQSIQGQIAQARTLLSDPSTLPVPQPSPATAVQLSVNVTIAPELAGTFPADASLFVFARAVDGAAVPVAIARHRAGELPITIVLDDSMGMLPGLKLSTLDQVVIGARISAIGEALPQSGDLQGFSAPVDTNTRAPVDIVIRDTVP